MFFFRNSLERKAYFEGINRERKVTIPKINRLIRRFLQWPRNEKICR